MEASYPLHGKNQSLSKTSGGVMLEKDVSCFLTIQDATCHRGWNTTK